MSNKDNIDITISDENIVITTFGEQGAPGTPGADGTDGLGVPAGGTTDQILSKIDGTDNNTEWVTVAGAVVPSLNDLTDVTIVAVSNDEVLQYTGAGWENQSFVEAGIQPFDANTVIDASYVQTELSFTTALKTNYDAAYTHSISTHAPANADNTAANETSHADVLVDGEFITAGFMKTDGTGNYSIDASAYSLSTHLHAGVYEPANANLLETTDIGILVQVYDVNTVVDANYVQTELSFTTALKTNYDAAYNHSISAHAPANADNTAANETSHADVLVDGEFATGGLMKTDGAGNYSIDANAYSLTTHLHTGVYATSAQGALADSALQNISAESLTDLSDIPTIIGNAGKLLKVNPTEDGYLWGDPAGTTVAWGDITGTLSSQTDLQGALDGKSSTSHVHEGVDIDATAITDGYVLTADGAGNSAWELNAAGGASVLDDLTDVTVTNVTAGEVLVFAGSPAIAINRLLLENDISNFGSYSLTSHDHTGVYEPANANLLETADIGVSVQGYDANTVIDASYVQTELSFTTALKTNYDAAYNHSISAHAPTNADNTAANETSHADVLVDGEFATSGFMKTDGAGNYSIDANAYSLTTHVHEGTEIDATAITDGFVLTADGAGNSAWEVSASGGATTLNELTDVTVGGSPFVIGDVLTYDGAVWVNSAPTGGGGVTDHDNLTNNGGAGSHATISAHISAKSPHNNWLSVNEDTNVAFSATARFGTDGIAIGNAAETIFDDSIAIGTGAYSKAADGICIGRGSKVESTSAGGAIAIGLSARANGDRSLAIGQANQANNNGVICIGEINIQSGTNNIAIGNGNGSTGNGTITIGSDITNNTTGTTIIGTNATTNFQLSATGGFSLVGTTTQFVQPNYTTAALPTGTLGGTVFDTTSTTLNVYNGSTWDALAKRDATLNTKTASYTLILSDADTKIIEMNLTATANNLTVPPNSSVAFPIGTRIDIVQYGTGVTTVVQGAGVTIRTAETLVLDGQYAGATLYKRATDEWLLIGRLVAV